MRMLCEHMFFAFGERSEFRPGAYAVHTEHIDISNDVVIRPGCMLFADEQATITIGSCVLLGSGVHVYVNNHNFDKDCNSPIMFQGYGSSEGQDVRLNSGCWIGANSVILPGVNIGYNAVVGAGSVVTNSVPDFMVVAGNPAREIRKG